MLSLKQRFLGTAIGRLAICGRDTFELANTILSRRENVGGVANDQLASQLITRLCHPDKTFIDVGAHIGSVIAAVLHHAPSIGVIAFEAIPEKADNLKRRFPKAKIYTCALSESEGKASFFIDTQRSGYSSLGKIENKKSTVEITVPLKKLDSIVSSNQVDAVKIDVEGAELGVLRGSENLITANHPVIMFESAPTADNGLGYTKEALWQWFAGRGYEVLVPNRLAHDGPALSLDGFIESHYYPRRTTNYFAIPAERRIEIRDRARKILKLPGS